MAQNSYLVGIADTILHQIIAGVGISTYWSWGVANVGAAYFKDQPSLLLAVNGLLHKGLALVSYDDSSDTYVVRLFDKDGKETRCVSDLYCDNIGETLDSVVERDPEWSQEEYAERLENLPPNEKPFDNVEVNVIDGYGTLLSISNF